MYTKKNYHRDTWGNDIINVVENLRWLRMDRWIWPSEWGKLKIILLKKIQNIWNTSIIVTWWSHIQNLQTLYSQYPTASGDNSSGYGYFRTFYRKSEKKYRAFC